MTQSWSSFNAKKRCEPPHEFEKDLLTCVLLEFAEEPGTSKSPPTLGRRDGDAQGRSRLGSR